MSKNARFGWLIAVIVVVCILGIAGLRFFPSRSVSTTVPLTQQPTDPPGRQVVKPKLNEVLGIGEDEFVEVGGVQRPKRDVEFATTKRERVESTKSPFAHPGHAKAAEKDANPEVAGLFEELSSEDVPNAAKNSMFAPEPFKLEEYQRDPEAWLTQIRPGRVFQPAQPGDEVKPIATKTPGFHNVLQGERVILEAQVDPNAPVSFYTPQVGFFENQLKSQSVAADENGIARVVYTAGPGTNGVVDIVAASPLHSGQLRYRVRVSLP